MRKLIAIISLSLLLIPLTVGATSGIEVIGRDGDGYWHRDTWRVDLYPGETVETTLRLKNNTSKSVRVRLDAIPDKHYDEVKFWWDDDSLTISGYHTAKATLYAEVSGSVPPSRYEARLTIEWEEKETKPPPSPSRYYYTPPLKPSKPPATYPPAPQVIHSTYVPPPQAPVAGSELGLGGWICIVVVGASLIVAMVYLEKKRREAIK